MFFSFKIKDKNCHRGRYTHHVHENCPIFQTPYPLVQIHPKFFYPLDLGRPFSNSSPQLSLSLSVSLSLSLSRNSNKSIKIKYNSGMNIMCYQVFPSGRLLFNSLILYGFLLTSFHLAEANLVPRAIFVLFVDKLLRLRLKRKQIMEQQPFCLCE